VNSPGSVLYRRGAKLDYYLSAAAASRGRRKEAGERAVRERRGPDAPWRPVRQQSHAGAGSEVVVPFKDPNAPHTDTVALFGAIAQILASTVAIIVIAKR